MLKEYALRNDMHMIQMIFRAHYSGWEHTIQFLKYQISFVLQPGTYGEILAEQHYG